VSDEYCIALPYKLCSPITVKYATPLMGFDEVVSFIKLLPYTILIMLFAIPLMLVQRSKFVESQDNRKKQDD
jgi:Na+/H+ antiporter NhaC